VTNREQQEQVAGVLQQADELRTKLRAQDVEIDALRELWAKVLPGAWMPGDEQFVVWLRRYGFARVEKGVAIAGSRRHQVIREAKRYGRRTTPLGMRLE
jgi:hypothetical protein